MDKIVLLPIALLLAYGVGCLGRKRKIGFWWAFVLALFNLLIALIVVFCSKKLEDVDFVEADKKDKE